MKTKPLHDRLGIREIYKHYRSENYITKETKVLYKDFTTVCANVNKRISEKMLEGKSFKFPNNLGIFYIRKRKLNFDKLKFNYALFNKTGQKSFFLNEHSRKFYAKWYWEKIACRIPGHTLYSFIPSRENKRALAQVMFQANGFKKYIE